MIGRPTVGLIHRNVRPSPACRHNIAASAWPRLWTPGRRIETTHTNQLLTGTIHKTETLKHLPAPIRGRQAARLGCCGGGAQVDRLDLSADGIIGNRPLARPISERLGARRARRLVRPPPRPGINAKIAIDR
jgi:hypothetical protein